LNSQLKTNPGRAGSFIISEKVAPTQGSSRPRPAASFKGSNKFDSILCFKIIQAVAANPNRSSALKSAPRNGPDALRPIRGIFGALAPQNPRIELCTRLITGATAHRYQAAPRSSGPLATKKHHAKGQITQRRSMKIHCTFASWHKNKGAVN
jgi:hypothetical protein